MAKVRPWAVAAAATAVVAIGAGAYTLHKRRTKPTAPRRTTNPAPRPAAQQGADEPSDGYETRWLAARDDAIAKCQADDDVESFAQAVTCALNTAFPEAAPWTEPAIWTPWMDEAFELVRDDLLLSASRDGQSPRAWEVLVWLRGRRELVRCVREGASALCAASRIYPSLQWNSPDPWQHEFLAELERIGRQL